MLQKQRKNARISLSNAAPGVRETLQINGMIISHALTNVLMPMLSPEDAARTIRICGLSSPNLTPFEDRVGKESSSLTPFSDAKQFSEAIESAALSLGYTWNELMVDAVMNLWKSILSCPGVAILGQAMVGKTMLWTVLAGACEKVGPGGGNDEEKSKMDTHKNSSDKNSRAEGTRLVQAGECKPGGAPGTQAGAHTNNGNEPVPGSRKPLECGSAKHGCASKDSVVTICRINPKACSKSILFGEYDPKTNMWVDGLLGIAVRKSSDRAHTDNTSAADRAHSAPESKEEHDAPPPPNHQQARHWIILDGPVDLLWSEDLHTMLEDDGKLHLMNREQISASPRTTVLFEVDDLTNASPAFTSRVGVVYVDHHTTAFLGWREVVTSWSHAMATQHDQSPSTIKGIIFSLFVACFEVALNFVTSNMSPCPSASDRLNFPIWLSTSILRKIEAIAFEDEKVDKSVRLKHRLETSFLFSLAWSVGTLLTTETLRDKFHHLLIHLFSPGASKEVLHHKYGLSKRYSISTSASESQEYFPGFEENLTMFDYFLAPDFTWRSWTSALPLLEVNPHLTEIYQIIVPTVATQSTQRLLDLLSRHNVLIYGASGTGKTMSITDNLLRRSAGESEHVSFALTIHISPQRTRSIIDTRLEKRRRGIYGPRMGKKLTVFVDDLNLPCKQIFGAQRPLEIFREILTFGGSHHEKSKEFRQIKDTSFLTAYTCPSLNTLPPRLLQHFHAIALLPLTLEDMNWIFSNTTKWYLSRYTSGVAEASHSMVSATLGIYEKVMKHLKRTPVKCHYTFNIRDLVRIFQGILTVPKRFVVEVDDLIRIWVHENNRVLGDRLVNAGDNQVLTSLYEKRIDAHFKKNYEEIVKQDPLIYTDILDDKLYREVDDPQRVITFLTETLEAYNASAKLQLDLVLFLKFCELIVRTIRVLRLHQSSAMLVGLGGSGKRTVCALSVHCVEYKLFQMEMTKNHSIEEWHEDMKHVLFPTLRSKPSALLFCDSKALLPQERFLEDVSSLINTGTIVDLWNADDRAHIMEMYAKRGIEENSDKSVGNNTPAAEGIVSKKLSKAEQPAKEKQELWKSMQWYAEQSRKHLHILYCISPCGHNLRSRASDYPSLFTSCTIIWFPQWPEEVLKTVAERYLASNTYLEGEAKHQSEIFSVCAKIHDSVQELALKLKDTEGKHVYVAQPIYLHLLHNLVSLLENRTEEMRRQKKLYDLGVDKIKNAKEAVKMMMLEVETLTPILKAHQEENVASSENIEKMKKKIAVTTQSVTSEENAAEKCKALMKDMRKEIQGDFAIVGNKQNEAEALLRAVTKKDLLELKVLKSPSGAQAIMGVFIHMLFKSKPSGKKDETPSFEVTKKLYALPLIKKMLEFDIESLLQPVASRIEKDMESMDCDPDTISGEPAANATKAICAWLAVLPRRYKATMEAAPRRTKLSQTEEQYAEIAEKLKDRKDEIDAQTKKLEWLQNDQAKSKKEKNDCSAKITKYRAELLHYDKLLSIFGDDVGHWEACSEKIGQEIRNALGDLFLAAFFVTYLGPFNAQQRDDELRTAISLLKNNKIASSEERFSLPHISGGSFRFIGRQNTRMGLPTDARFIDSLVILQRSRRWPLMIDPQRQAVRWVTNTFSNSSKGQQLKLAYITHPEFQLTLEASITAGHALLIAECPEKMECIFEPLLRKAIFKAGTMDMIRVGDNTVEYCDQFTMYMATSLSNPHFPSEVTSFINMVDFSLTLERLTDAVLAHIIQIENLDAERRLTEVITESVQMEMQLEELEDRVLHTIASISKQEANVTQEVMGILQTSKQSRIRIEERMNTMERVFTEIDDLRVQYMGAAEQYSALYFVLLGMSRVRTVYQFSIEWYLQLLGISLRGFPKNKLGRDGKRPDRLQVIMEEPVNTLYTHMCGYALFENDKPLFTFLLALKMEELKGHAIDPNLLSIFATNFTRVGTNISWAKPEAMQDCVTDEQWEGIMSIDLLLPVNPAFKDFSKKFVKNKTQWGCLLREPDLLKGTWPDDLNATSSLSVSEKKRKEERHSSADVEGGDEDSSKRLHKRGSSATMMSPPSLTWFEQVVVETVLKPHMKLTRVRQFILSTLGPSFLDAPDSRNLSLLVDHSSPHIPLVFTHEEHEYALPLIHALAKRMGKQGGNVLSIALGQGSEDRAMSLMEDAARRGAWMVFENFHALPSFMAYLEQVFLDYSSSTSEQVLHREFRLVLTCMASSCVVPNILLQHGLKIAVQTPSGVKMQLQHLYADIGSQDLFMNPRCNHFTRKMCFSLATIHTILMEKRRLGLWTFPYAFGTDAWHAACADLIPMAGRENDWDKTYKYAQHMITDMIYGAYMMDENDTQAFKRLVHEYIGPGMENKKRAYLFPPPCPDLRQSTSCTHKEHMDLIKKIPSKMLPSEMGFHDNAEYFADFDQSLYLAAHTVQFLPSGARRFQDESYLAKARNLYSLVNETPFNWPSISHRFESEQHDLLNTVVPQELDILDRLLRVMQETLDAVLRTASGEDILLAPEQLEELELCLLHEKVPHQWSKVAYLTKRRLASFVQNFIARRHYFGSWLEGELPETFRISLFAYPNALLTSLVHIHCQMHNIPVNMDSEKIKFGVYNSDSKRSIKNPVIDGILLEGADIKHWIMELPVSKTPYKEMPSISIISRDTTSKDRQADFCNQIALPLYKFRPFLADPICASVGRNFICDIHVPTKSDDTTPYFLKGVILVTEPFE